MGDAQCSFCHLEHLVRTHTNNNFNALWHVFARGKQKTKETKMETTIEQKPDALAKIVETSGLEKTKADYILQKFQDYFRLAAEWEAKAKMLVVTSETQIVEMKMARTGRLFLKEKRVAIEKTRKELKEESLREGKAVDGISNVLKALIEPIEQYLEEQENFVEIREDRSKEERKTLRVTEIQTLGLDPLLYDLKNMPEENYVALIAGQKLAIQQKIDAEQKAEQERIEREKEQERIRLENERLRAEAIEKERIMAEERAKAEAERKAMEEKTKKEREIAEAKAKKERDEAEKKLTVEKQAKAKLEAELRAKAEAEEAEKKRIEREQKAAQKAPDKQKLLTLAEKIEALEMPDAKSAEAKKILSDTRGLLNKTAKFIREQTENL